MDRVCETDYNDKACPGNWKTANRKWTELMHWCQQSCNLPCDQHYSTLLISAAWAGKGRSENWLLQETFLFDSRTFKCKTFPSGVFFNEICHWKIVVSIKRARGTAAQFCMMQRLTGSTPSEGHHDRIEGVKFRQGSLQVNAFSLSAVVFMVLMNFFPKNHISCHNVWFHFTGQTLLTSIFLYFTHNWTKII